MRWVLECGLQDFGYLSLIEALERSKIKHTIVKVVMGTTIIVSPDFDTFSSEATEEDNITINDDKIFPFGTMGLSLVANERNWNPGSLFNNEFTFEKWSKGFGLENILNSESKVLTMSSSLIDYDQDVFFIRPCEDNKAFSGQIIKKEDFIEWQKAIIAESNPIAKLNKDTRITVAPYKEILNESRLFVFNGKVVTGSYYKFGNKVIYREVLDGDPVISYTNNIVKNYQPAEAFVLDVALTEDGFKIIEINNINSVGLYYANVYKFIDAVNTNL